MQARKTSSLAWFDAFLPAATAGTVWWTVKANRFDASETDSTPGERANSRHPEEARLQKQEKSKLLAL